MAYTSTQLKTLASNIKINAKPALIEQINIDTSRMRASATNRSIQVVGGTDAIFSLQVSRSSDGEYYDFTTRAFEDNITSQSRLKNQSPGSTSIAFPAAAGGDTYTIHVFAEPHFNTELNFGKNKLYYSTTITQVADAKITFKTNELLNAALTNITSKTTIGTSTGSIVDSFATAGAPTVVMSDLKLTVVDENVNHGAFITSPTIASDPNNGTWNSSALYWQTGNYVANGAGTDSTALILDSVDDLYIGMQVSYVNTVFQTALRSITAIDTDTKTLTLDGNETWSNDHVIIFRAYGPNLIKTAIGIGLALSNPTCRLGQESTLVKTAITSGTPTAVVVKGSQGIAVGATVRGKFVDNSSSTDPCSISSIAVTSTTNSTINITNGRFDADTNDIQVNTILYVDGSSGDIYLGGTIHISKYPSGDEDIYVDLSKIFTAGED